MEALDQSAIRQAIKQEIVLIPDWLEVGKYAFSPQHNTNVKVLGILGNLANCLLLGTTQQIPISNLTEPTLEVKEIDLGSISHPTYHQIASEWFEEISGVQILPGQPAHYFPLPDNLHYSVKQGLKSTGINQFYRHQLQSWEALNQHRSICITTPTASGKTNAFVPFAFHQALTKQRTSLLIYPLKALASDQYAKLITLNEALPPQERLFIAKCTGDVPLATRKEYFQRTKCPDIIVISPDVLHHLLYHSNKAQMVLWKEFLFRLGMVVCDESHTYLSSFGIHFVNLLRRVRLACVNAGQVPKEIKWVISTATISNPLELASQLSGLSPNDITLIDQSGAKAHERTVLVFQPQNSPNFACANLLSSLLNYDLKGLVFVNARRTAKQIFSLLSHHHGGWINNVDLFYGSLKPAQRKERLEKLSLGRNKIIITTNCLEAGIDLPDLDFVVLRGFPSLNGFWQRGGRCGRKSPGLIIFIPDSNNHIDYYYATQPERLLSPVEKVKIQPNYPSILSRHLLCAGAEGGIKATEVTQYFGNKSDLIVGELLKQHQLFWSREQILWRRGYPHGDVSLRGIQDQNIELIDVKTSEVLEEMPLELAYRECYPGAIYLTSSEGKTLTWRCLELDAENAKAKLKLGDLEDKRTIPFVQLNIKTTTNLETPKIITTPKGNLRLSFWWGTIGHQVSGYQETLLIYAPTCINRQCSYYYVPQTPQATNCPKCKRQLKKLLSTKVIDDVIFDQSLETNYEAPILGIEVNDILAKEIINYHQQIKQSLRTIYGNPDNIPHQIATILKCEPVYLTLHSLSHLLIKTVPLLFLASHQDLSSFTVERPVKWDNPHRTLVYIFDSVHEGCGTTEALVNDWDACVQKALELASNCDCGDLGCPRCLTEYGCPESNEALSKLSGMWLLEQIANGTFS